MMSTSTEDRIRRILVEILGIENEKIHLASVIYDDLGADSLDEIEIVMACEDEFGVEVPDDDAAKVRTVADMVKLASAILGQPA